MAKLDLGLDVANKRERMLLITRPNLIPYS